MTTNALADFLSIGGRIMLAPDDRKLTSTIDMAALFAASLPEDEAERRGYIVRAFARYERKASARLRRLVASEGRPCNGFTVLEGAAHA